MKRVLGTLLLSGVVSVAAADVPTGIYSTVSESEWQIYVELKAGGVANIRHEAWLPDGNGTKNVKGTGARWSVDGNVLKLSYEGVTDSFEYTPQLSLKELGLEGGAAGLRQMTPIDRGSRVSGHSLWLEPHRFGTPRRHDAQPAVPADGDALRAPRR